VSTFQEVDLDDLTTVVFDYNDQTGANNPGGVKTWWGVGGVFGLNAPGVSIDTTDRNDDGIPDTTFSYEDIVQTSFKIRFQATSYDYLRAAIGTVQRLLSSDGVIKWIPTGSSNTYYIYRRPSSIPALFSGNDLELYKAGALYEFTQDITINRERLLRGPTLLASVNALKENPTLLRFSGGSSTAPDSWAWDSTTGMTFASYAANVNWPTRSYRFVIATTGTRNLQQTTVAATAAPGDVWTFSFYARASGGTLCKAQAVVEFMSSAPAVLATATGTLTTLSSTEQRLSVTTAAAPASTDHIRMNIRFANGDTTSYTVDLRNAQLEKAATTSQFRVGTVVGLLNLVGSTQGDAKSFFVYNPGDADALIRLTALPSAATKTVALFLARRAESGDVNLAEAINQFGATLTTRRTQQLVIDTTMYSGTAGDTASAATAGDSDLGNAAKTTFTNQASLVRRWRWVSTPTDPEALHGRWQVYAAVKPEAGSGTDTRYRVSLHWQAANRDPVANVGDEINLDTTDATTSSFVPLLLGEVTFDANAGDTALVLEGWAARDAGSGSLWWDAIYLVPVDEQATLLQVPGFRLGDQANETWLGSELTAQVAGAVSGATISGTKVVLDTVNQGVGTPPSSATTGGLVWAAGRHAVTALVDLRVPAGTAATGIGRLRIRKGPGVGVVVQTWAAGVATLGGIAIAVGMFVKPTGGNLNSRTYVCTSVSGTHTTGGAEPTWPTTDGGTVTDNPGANQIVWTETTVASRQFITKKNFTRTTKNLVVAYDTDGTTAYEAVAMAGSGITGVSGKIHVLKLDHTVLRTIDDGYSLQMLGDSGILQTANGSTAADLLLADGPLITLGPGLNVLWLDVWSVPPLAYDDMDDRDALALHDPIRSTTVSVDVQPRYYG
jgi:hypothetical protein